jgi:hypothetical protein
MAHAPRLARSPHGLGLLLDLGLVLGCPEPTIRHLIPGGFTPGVPGGRSHPTAFALVVFEFGSEVHGPSPLSGGYGLNLG